MKRLITSIISIMLYQMIVFAQSDDYQMKSNVAKEHYESENLVPALAAAHDALELAWQTNDSDLITTAHMRLFAIYYKYGAYKMALQAAKRTLEEASSADLKHRSMYNLGLAYKKMGIYDSALLQQQEAYDYFLKTKDVKRVCLTLNEIGLCHWYSYNYAAALRYYKDLEDFSAHSGNQKYVGWAVNNMANTYIKMKDTANAELYLNRAVKLNTGRDLIQTYMNLASISVDPYGYLIAAKDAYTSELDSKDYLGILHKLRNYHAGSDSSDYYAHAIADTHELTESRYADISHYNKLLLIMQVEHQVRTAKDKRKSDRERFYMIIGISIGILIIIYLLWMYNEILKRRKRDRYMMNIQTWQNQRLNETLDQYLSLKTPSSPFPSKPD